MSKLQSSLDALQRFYGSCRPRRAIRFALFVWEVLSVHSTPRKRDAAMRAETRPCADAGRDVAAPQKKLEESVALAGPYLEQRMRALRTGVDMFRRTPNAAGSDPRPAPRRAAR